MCTHHRHHHHILYNHNNHHCLSGVGHFQTLYELSSPAAKLLGSFSPAQLASVVEALGNAGVSDAELMKAVSATVTAKLADFSASQLTKVLAGFAAAGVADVALTKAVLGALAGKAGADASAKDLCQLVWALGKMGRCGRGWAYWARAQHCIHKQVNTHRGTERHT